MSIQSDIRALTIANPIELSQANLFEVCRDYATHLGFFVKNNLTCQVYLVDIGLWTYKDTTYTTKDRANPGDYLVLFCKTYTLDGGGNKVWTDGEVKLLTPAQFAAKGYVETLTPTTSDTYQIFTKPVTPII